jgi:spindle assembly abnormal protein 6
LRAKLKGTEEELDGIRQEIQTVRKDNSSLDAQHHQMTKTLNQLETKAAVLEQEVKNKDLMIDKTNKLLELEREQKSSVSLQLEQQNRQVTKLDTAYRQLTQEVKKGNEIIAKLQGEVKDLKSKLKVRNMVTMKQEEVINEKGKEIDTYRNEVKTLSETVRAKDGDVDKLKREIGTLQETCEQQKETLKNNENIISWLNKQINEQGVPKVGGALPHPQDALSSIRPYTSGLYQPRFSSTPAGRGANNEGRHVLGPLQNYPQKVLFHGPVKHQSGAVPSPLVASELTSPSFNPMVIKTSPPNIPQLDRYLPPLTGTGTAIGTTIPTSCTSIPTSGTSIPTAIPTKVSPQAPSGTNTLLTPPFSKPLPLNKHVRSN